MAVRVKVTLLPEATDPLATPTVEVAVEMVPGETVAVGNVEVTAEPPIVAPTVVAVPASTPVKVAA